MKYEFMICGVVDDGFTSAEISEPDAEGVARVFESQNGWYVETDRLERLREPAFVEALLQARDELLHYVNRKGGEPPEGTSRAAFSLWLMQRDDGKGFSVGS